MAIGFFSKLIGGSIGEMAEGVAKAIDRFVETGEEKKAAEMLALATNSEIIDQTGFVVVLYKR